MNARGRVQELRRLREHEAAGDEASGARLIDAVMTMAPDHLEQPLLSSEEARDFERLREAEERRRAAEAVAKMTLSDRNLKRGGQVRASFEAAGDAGEVGERLLEELVAGEVAVALELSDVEATLAAMLRSVQSNPEVTLVVLKTLKEAVSLSDAIRRRMQNSLAAAATLRTQRQLVAAQRGRLGV